MSAVAGRAAPGPVGRKRARGWGPFWSMPSMVGLYVLTRGFMIARSGLPQLSDLAMLGLFTRLRASDARWVSDRHLPFVALVVWIVTVNVAWAALQQETEYLVFSSYYAFNLLVFTLVARTYIRDPEQTRANLNLGAQGAIALQVVLVLIEDEYRAKGGFNNPNQLGYFGICVLSIYLVTLPRRRAELRDFLVVAAVMWLELKSLSRAGMAGSALVVALWLREVLRSPRARVVLLGLAALGVIAAVVPELGGAVFGEDSLFASVEQRLNARMSTYDELTIRNTQRIGRHATYTVLGAGEGDFDRFADQRNIEVHSSLGTLFFSYGLLGVGLFLAFLWQILRRLPRDHWGYLGAVLLYSLTHNGLRFTYGWVLLALLAGVGHTLAAPRAAAR